AACSGAQDSAGRSPTAPSASQASASNQAGLTAAQSAALSAVCGPLGSGDGTVTSGTPPTGTPPPGAVIGGPGGLGPGGTVTIGTPPSGPTRGAELANAGAAESLAGSCPSISFTVHGNGVRTNATTAFGRGSCSSLQSGDRIGAVGTLQADGSILASCVASGI